MSEERGRGDDEAGEADGEAEEEVGALTCEQGDGGEDDGDLEQSFAEIEAGGLLFGSANLGFEMAGFGLLVSEVVLPAVDLFLVLGTPLSRFGRIVDGLKSEEIDGVGEVFAADLFGLVLVPNVAGAGLLEDGLGVAAMAEHGDHGD